MESIIQLQVDGVWHDAAILDSRSRNECFFEYLPDYIFGDIAKPVSLNLPVSFDSRHPMGLCPPFLLDIVPQGEGRKYLIQKLNLIDSDDLILPIIQHGAFNPIGRLRLDTAVAFFNEHVKNMSVAEHDLFKKGYKFEDIIGRKGEFIEQLALHGMLGSGTTGLQGAAPKFMLTTNRDDLWFVDMALPDNEAVSHWIVKLPRGKHESDETVLRNEACYLNVAFTCGLRSHAKPVYRDGMLFVPRFDRIVKGGRVVRLHQESLASVAGHTLFGVRANHFDLVEAFYGLVSDPVQEIAEYINRDILNQAIRNTDNHARNTALQQLPDGTVQLTPVFDVAPMFLDREMIARSCRWLDHGGREMTDLSDIIGRLPVNENERNEINRIVRRFTGKIAQLQEIMRDNGVDQSIIDQCKVSIERQFNALSSLPANGTDLKHG
jgi:serine/threonine-protein kinase HipA